jgi:hypothetical protein
MIENSPILISGIPRSGASRIAGVINMCGAFGGVMHAPYQTVERGMYENISIRKIEEDWLKALHMDPTGCNPIPPTKSPLIPIDWNTRVENAILQENYQSGEWMYKSNRISLLWPIWHYAFPNAKWIIVRRKTSDIIKSCKETAFMQGYTSDEGWKEMVHIYEERFSEMINAGVNCKVIWPQRMEDGNYQQLYEMLDWLNLPWKNEVLSYIDPLFWKSRQKERK